MRILHLVDDEKFIDHAVNQFEACNSKGNVYLLAVDFLGFPLIHVKSPLVIVRQIFSEDYWSIVFRENYDFVVIHCLDYRKCRVLLRLPLQIKTIWLAWGGDFYYSSFFKKPLYHSRTKAFLKRAKLRQPYKAYLRPLMVKVYRRLLGVENNDKLFQKTVSRIDFCATVVPNEIDILREVDFFKAEQVRFAYASIDESSEEPIHRDSTLGYSILIGNSNTFESNHLDAFIKVKGLECHLNKLIVPLSYGSAGEDYKRCVLRQGKNLFGAKFCPLLGFLTKDEYENMIRKCGIAVFYHERQQAVGNIISMLFFGAKVFLSTTSPVYVFLKDLGVHIFSIQKDLVSENLGALSIEEIRENRRILLEEYSEKAVLQKTANLLSTIEMGA